MRLPRTSFGIPLVGDKNDTSAEDLTNLLKEIFKAHNGIYNGLGYRSIRAYDSDRLGTGHLKKERDD
jgi:hypothetical protein